MHAVFIPYGKRSEVELMLRDMEAQKHGMPFTKDGKTQIVFIQGQVRFLPFGIYEYVFPREDADKVLTSLKFHNSGYIRANISWFKEKLLQSIAKCEPTPQFKTDNQYLWIRDFVNIIPLGVRYDKDMTEISGQFEGWTHEAT